MNENRFNFNQGTPAMIRSAPPKIMQALLDDQNERSNSSNRSNDDADSTSLSERNLLHEIRAMKFRANAEDEIKI